MKASNTVKRAPKKRLKTATTPPASENCVADEFECQSHRAPANFEAIEWRDIRDRADKATQRLFGILEQLHEADHCRRVAPSESRGAPLPDWARTIIGDAALRHEIRGEYHLAREMLDKILRLSHGEDSAFGFEVWTTKGEYSRRLSIRLESMKEAQEARDWWRHEGSQPDAFVIRLYVRARAVGSASSDPAMLDTLVGKVWHSSTTFRRGDEEDHIEVQDETGRACTQTASMIRAHAIFGRLNKFDQRRVEHSLIVAKNRAKPRAEARLQNGGSK